jgi:hypothetical protein
VEENNAEDRGRCVEKGGDGSKEARYNSTYVCRPKSMTEYRSWWL